MCLTVNFPSFSVLAIGHLIFSIQVGDVTMVDAPRITVNELHKRMEAGEDFTLIDTRNPQAWAESDVMMPDAIRMPLDNVEENLSRIPRDKPIVAYCT
jgi:hypothetical protein